MNIMNFTKQEKEALVQKLQNYFAKELDQELGQFEAGFLLNFITDEIGPFYYNRGIQDARAMLQKRVDDIAEAIDTLEKPTRARR